MKELFGLPAHPLLVHGAVVLVPLACVVTAVTALVPRWRARLALPALGAGLVGVVATMLAVWSGEGFNDELEPLVGEVAERHEALAGTTRMFVLLLFAAQLALYLSTRWTGRRGADPRSGVLPAAYLGHGLAALTLVLAVLSTVWMVRTGHEGADIVWKDTWDSVTADDG
jgi:hypothetical protein